jgi:hypothetical protein
MKKSYSIIILLTAIFSTCKVYGQAKVKDYLTVPGPISFDNINYDLSWSSHPSDNYFKHEYLPKGDDAEKYKKMILIEFIEGGFKAKDAVNAKVSELKELKKTNPVVNYEVIENKQLGESILDLLVSENTPDGKHVSIVERNVYRFKKVEDASGRKGILLFGISIRAYGDDIDKFFALLKTNRDDMINAVAAYSIPGVKIAN